MTKERIVKTVASATGRIQALVDEILSLGLYVIGKSAASGSAVRWPGFGTLEAVERPARMYRHPATGEMTIKRSASEFRFRAAGALKKAANPPRRPPKAKTGPKPKK